MEKTARITYVYSSYFVIRVFCSGYTLKSEDQDQGNSQIRTLSRISTALLWYLTHLLLDLRETPFKPRGVTLQQPPLRIALKIFDSILAQQQWSETEAFSFILRVLKELCSKTDPQYKTVFVRDSLETLDILVENEKDEIKEERNKWESEFHNIVSKFL